MTPPDKGERIAKLIARAGLCSRREAERWIQQGRVTLDGKVLISPGTTVDDPKRIQVDGKPLPRREPARLWRYHKLQGLVTTHRDPEGRPTIFQSLPTDLPRVISVGRLDLHSEGLLLLTNDGELARYLELPTTKMVRQYRLQVKGNVKQEILNSLSKGITIEGVRYKNIEAKLLERKGLTSWLTLKLIEGKNREIRRIADHFGWKVTKLVRIAYGPFRLDKLKPGEVKEIASKLVLATKAKIKSYN